MSILFELFKSADYYPQDIEKLPLIRYNFMAFGSRQAVRQRFLVPSCAGSNPASRTKKVDITSVMSTFLIILSVTTIKVNIN